MSTLRASAHPERCAAKRIVLVTVLRVSRPCEHLGFDEFDLHLLRAVRQGSAGEPLRASPTLFHYSISIYYSGTLLPAFFSTWREGLQRAHCLPCRVRGLRRTARLCLGPYGGPQGETVSYERGTPAPAVPRSGFGVSVLTKKVFLAFKVGD